MRDHLYLPVELLSDILIRLPSKVLLRCTSVCKSWHDLIKSPQFITAHLVASRRNLGNQILVGHRRGDRGPEKYSIHRDNEEFNKLVEFDFPFGDATTFNATASVIHCHNGLVFLSARKTRYTYKHALYLWNPSIRKKVEIPQPDWVEEWNTTAFGFSAESNDCKIVFISDRWPWNAGVYKLSTGSWNKIESSKKFVSQYAIRTGNSQLFFNDKVHWIGHDRYAIGSSFDNFPWVMVTFDMKKVEFGLMAMPTDLALDRTLQFNVMLLSGSLALMQATSTVRNVIECRVWVMNEYGASSCWTKHLTVALNNRPVAFTHNGDALLKILGDLVSYDLKSHKKKNIGVDTKYVTYAHNFVESLLLLEKLPLKHARL